MVRAATAMVVLLSALALPVHGQGLAWKLKEGETFFTEATTTTKQVIVIADKSATQTTTVTTVTGFKVLKVAEGVTQLQQTVEGVRVKTDDATAASATRAGNLLKGQVFKVSLNAAGQVTRFEGYAELLKKLTGGNEAAEKATRAMLSEEALKEELHTLFGFLPDKAATPGTTWKHPVTLTLGPIGSLTGDTVFTYRGPAEGGERIDVTRTLTYAMPKDQAAGAFRVTKADLKVDQAAGTILFDPAAGRLVKQEMTTKVSGSLTTSDGGTDTRSFKVVQDSTRTVRLLDKNPLN